MNHNNSLAEFFGEPIYSYTRAQAIADGALVNVTETALVKRHADLTP